MTCIEITVVGQGLIVSDLTVNDTGGGNLSVKWNQDIPGSVRIKLDGSVKSTINIGVAGLQQVMIQNVPVGTHTVCVEAV